MTGSAIYRAFACGAHAVEPVALAMWRRAVVLSAQDDTRASEGRRCLVIAPHPDDETIACGATITRKRAAGTPVTVLVVADGRYAQPGSRHITPADLAAIRSIEVVSAGMDALRTGEVIELAPFSG